MNTLPSSALMIYFKDYEQYHQTKGNKVTHWIGVPGVMFSLLGMLSYAVLWAPSPDSLLRIDLGLLLFLLGAGFCFKVDKKLAVPFTLYAFFMYLLARHVSLQANIIVQVIAWGFQLFGHSVYEKKAPALLTTIEHAFIGPMWIFSWWIGYYKPPASTSTTNVTA